MGIQLHFGHQEMEFISCSLIIVLAGRECAAVAPFFVFAIDRTELYLHSALTCVLPLKVSVSNKSSGMLGYPFAPGAAGFQQLIHIPELLVHGAIRLPIQFNGILRRGVGRQQNDREQHPKPGAQHRFIY